MLLGRHPHARLAWLTVLCFCFAFTARAASDVSTVVTGLNYPTGVQYDSARHILYIADENGINRSSNGSTQLVVSMQYVFAMTLGADGTLYFANYNSGVIYALAPGASTAYAFCNVGAICITGLAFDSNGVLTALSANANCLCRVDANLNVTYQYAPVSIFGGLAIGGDGTAYIFDMGEIITLTPDGNCSSINSPGFMGEAAISGGGIIFSGLAQVYRFNLATQTIDIVAGDGYTGFVDSSTDALQARFGWSCGVGIGYENEIFEIFVADRANCAVRRVRIGDDLQPHWIGEVWDCTSAIWADGAIVKSSDLLAFGIGDDVAINGNSVTATDDNGNLWVVYNGTFVLMARQGVSPSAFITFTFQSQTPPAT